MPAASEPALVRLVGRRALGIARRLEVAPAAGPEPKPSGALLDGGDVAHRAVEERAVVRHHDERAAIRREEALEPLEALEVQVVRRLVQEQHVEPGEQDGCEHDSRRFATGQPCGSAVEVDTEAQVGAHGSCSCLEVVGAERHDVVERHRVAVTCRVAPVRERVRRLLELTLGRGHARTAREDVEDRLARLEEPLLIEIADGQLLRRAYDRARVGTLEPGDDPEQRRLARAVGPDEADPGPWADGECDLIENDLGAVLLADAGELDSHRRTSESRWTTRANAREERE